MKKKKILISIWLLHFIFITPFVNAQFTQIQAVGPTDVCYPNCANLEVVTPQAGYTYNWFVGIYDCNSVGNSTPIGIGPTYCALATGQFYCIGMPPTGPPEFSNPIDVRNLPGSLGSIYLPAPIPSGSITCVSSVSLCIPYGYYQGYPNTVIKWYKNNTLISGSTNGSYTVTATGYYKYSITSCALALSDSILVTTQPNVTVAAGGPTTICSGGSVSLSVTTGIGNSYQWKLNGSPVNGATNAVYVVGFAGGYTVTVTNNGCSKTSSPAINVVVNPLPSAIITPAGPTTFCSGGNVTLNASTGVGYGWQWLLNGNSINGATGSGYTANASGYYSVITTANGCSGTSAGTLVTINSLPNSSISAGGPTTFCKGGFVTLSAPVAVGSLYIWKKNGTSIAGATMQSYNAVSDGNYKVLVTNAAGCTKQTVNATVVNVNPLPAATISPQGPTTFCAGGNVVLNGNTGIGLTYKWKKNGAFIPGAINSNYTALVAGTYKIQVTNATGCSKISAGTVVSVPCKETNIKFTSSDFEVEIYPNPSNNFFNFSLVFHDFNKSDEKNNVYSNTIIVTDVMGRIMYAENDLRSNFSISGNKFPSGIYTATIKNASGEVNKRIVKIK